MGSHIVKICPGSILKINDEREDHWINMTNVQNLALQCGDDGDVKDSCIVDGGLHRC